MGGLTDIKKELMGSKNPLAVSETSPRNVAIPPGDLLIPSREVSTDPADAKFEPYQQGMVFDRSSKRQDTVDQEALVSIVKTIRTDPLPKTRAPPPTLASALDIDDDGSSSSDEKPMPATGRRKPKYAESEPAALRSPRFGKRSLGIKRGNPNSKNSRRHHQAASRNLTREQFALKLASLANSSSMAKRLVRTKALLDVHEVVPGKSKCEKNRDLELIFEQSENYFGKLLDRPATIKALFGVCPRFDLADGGHVEIVCGSLGWTTCYTNRRVPERPDEKRPPGDPLPGALSESPSAPPAFGRKGSMVHNTRFKFVSPRGSVSDKTETKDPATEKSKAKESPAGKPEAVLPSGKKRNERPSPASEAGLKPNSPVSPARDMNDSKSTIQTSVSELGVAELINSAADGPAPPGERYKTLRPDAKAAGADSSQIKRTIQVYSELLGTKTSPKATDASATECSHCGARFVIHRGRNRCDYCKQSYCDKCPPSRVELESGRHAWCCRSCLPLLDTERGSMLEDRALTARPPCNRILYVPARRSTADTVPDADIITLRMMTKFRVLSERKGPAFVVEYESPPGSGKATTRVLRLRQPELQAQFTQMLSWFFYTEQEQHHNDVVYEKVVGARDLVLSVVVQERHVRAKHRALGNRHIKHLKNICKRSASRDSGAGAQAEGAAGGGGDAPEQKGKSRDSLTAKVLKNIHKKLYEGERAYVKEIIDDATLVPLPRDSWQRDSAACAVCKAAFGMLKRRHNCKYCGKMVCSSCSHRKHMNRRVCDNCMDKPQDEAAVLQAYRAPCTCERGTCALFFANIVRSFRSKIIGLLKSPSEEVRLWALKLLWKLSLMQQSAVGTCTTPASSRGALGFPGELPLAYYVLRMARGNHLTKNVVNIIFNILIGKVSTEEAAADNALFSAKIFYVNLLPTLINASMACDVTTQFAVVEKLFLILPSNDNIDTIRSLCGWQSTFFQLFMGQGMHREIQMDRSAKVQQIAADSKKKRVISTRTLEKKSVEGKIIALTYAIFSFILRHDVMNRKVDDWEDSESFHTFAQLRSFAPWVRSVRSVGCMIMVTAINGIVNKEFKKKKKRKITVDFARNFSHLVATLIEIMVNQPPMDGEQAAGVGVEQSGRASDLELCDCAMKLATGLISHPQYRKAFHKKGPLHFHASFLQRLRSALKNIRTAPEDVNSARTLWNKTYKCSLRGSRVHRSSPAPLVENEIKLKNVKEDTGRAMASSFQFRGTKENKIMIKKMRKDLRRGSKQADGSSTGQQGPDDEARDSLATDLSSPREGGVPTNGGFGRIRGFSRRRSSSTLLKGKVVLETNSSRPVEIRNSSVARTKSRDSEGILTIAEDPAETEPRGVDATSGPDSPARAPLRNPGLDSPLISNTKGDTAEPPPAMPTTALSSKTGKLGFGTHKHSLRRQRSSRIHLSFVSLPHLGKGDSKRAKPSLETDSGQKPAKDAAEPERGAAGAPEPRYSSESVTSSGRPSAASARLSLIRESKELVVREGGSVERIPINTLKVLGLDEPDSNGTRWSISTSTVDIEFVSASPKLKGSWINAIERLKYLSRESPERSESEQAVMSEDNVGVSRVRRMAVGSRDSAERSAPPPPSSVGLERKGQSKPAKKLSVRAVAETFAV